VAQGLDYTFAKAPLFARFVTGEKPDGSPSGIFKRADNLFAVVREDTRATMGAVTGRYTIVQPREAFGALDALAREGAVTLSHISAVDGGAKMFVQANTGTVSIGGEPVQQYVLGIASFDGTGSVQYVSGASRLFCTNQLRGIMREAYFRELVRHTLSAHARIEDVRAMLTRVYATQKAFVATAETLLAQTFTRAEMEALALQLIPRPDPSDPTTTTREMRGWETRFERLMRDAYGAADLADIRYTTWGALNAVADYEQHLVPVKGDDEARESTLLRRAYEPGALVTRAADLIAAR
jgi:phage/plasmid-like protein (TIGR03299 family)